MTMMMMNTWQAAWWLSRAPDPQTLETGELPGCEYIGEDDDDHDDDGDDGVDDDVNGMMMMVLTVRGDNKIQSL